MAAINSIAAEPPSCRTTFTEQQLPISELSPVQLDIPGTIQLEAGAIEVHLGAMPTAQMSGGVLLRRDDKLTAVESARYDPEAKAIHLEGSVRYQDSGTQILSDSAEFGYETGRIRFEGAEFSLENDNARGAAAALEINKDGTLRICVPES